VQTIPSGTGLSINQASGRKNISNAEFIMRASKEAPSAIIAMSDEVSIHASKKKNRKSFDRTLQWFRELQGSSLINWNSTFLFGVATPMGDIDRFKTITSLLIDGGADGMLYKLKCLILYY
jgi:queuine/archaeosine tRNA-ribosyltransferase